MLDEPTSPRRLSRSLSWSNAVIAPSAEPCSASSIRSRHGEVAWTLGEDQPTASSPVRLPLASFNHIAREVLSLDKSKRFYVDILGFEVGPRPPFDSEGYWLYGYGLSLHLVQTTQAEHRKLLKRDRIKYFTTCLPKVDHIAFITSDISVIRKTLDERHVYYKEDKPGNTGIEQIFFFDPDGNVIEVSNCARIEQQCGALAAAAAAINRSRSSSRANLSHIEGELAEQCSLDADPNDSMLHRSPSQVYINGETVVLSCSPTSAMRLATLGQGLDLTSPCARKVLDIAIESAPPLSVFMPNNGDCGKPGEEATDNEYYFPDSTDELEGI